MEHYANPVTFHLANHLASRLGHANHLIADHLADHLAERTNDLADWLANPLANHIIFAERTNHRANHLAKRTNYLGLLRSGLEVASRNFNLLHHIERGLHHRWTRTILS
jgi:hypothetical protein